MLAQIIVTLPIIIGMKFVDSAPIDMRMGCSASSTAVTMPKWIGEMLTDNSDTAADQAIGLYSLYRNTEFFANQTLYKSEVYTPCTNASYYCGKESACMGIVFTHNYSTDTISSLTYSQLTNYYNEFVLQLKLAEYNLEAAIDLEIKESNRSKSMERERDIIRSLNESILPALEFTLNITQSKTNCAATAVLADLMISFSTNCVSCLAVNSSNESLKQTVKSLYAILDDNGSMLFNDDATPSPLEVDSSKKWCIVL